MATSPIYNWPEPDNTDLVKNGALAIRTLGDAIDTTMGTMVAKTLVDAKGDLIAGTAADTAARLAVGNNGETLVADSSTATGLSYQANFAAGKNKIINGDFGIWQRGTSFTNPTIGTYTSDRWKQGGRNAEPTSSSFTRQTFTPGTAPIAGYEGAYFARSTITTVGTTTTYTPFVQPIEDVRTFAGQTVTISFWAKSDSNRTGLVFMSQDFGSGGSSGVNTSTSNLVTTTEWSRFTFTVAVPSISGKTIGTSSSLALNIRQAAASGSVLDIWGVQVEAGSVATAFQTATGTIQGELAACQRYFVNYISGDAKPISVCTYYAGTWVIGMHQLPVTMRIAPSANVVNGTSYYRINTSGVFDLVDGIVYGNFSPNTVYYSISGLGASGTVGYAGVLFSHNASSSISFSAEL